MPAISVFDIFKIGIGPSSSHTVGPMKAAREFGRRLEQAGMRATKLEVRLYGSLSFTGKGHGTDSAIFLGLHGADPETVDPDEVGTILNSIRRGRRVDLPGVGAITFDPDTDLVFDAGEPLPRHTNGMRFKAVDEDGEAILQEDYFSIGGGFIVRDDEEEPTNQEGEPPYPFSNAEELLKLAEKNGLTVPELVCQNELSWRPETEVDEKLDAIWDAMQACVHRGLHTDGVLPGRMAVPRRAAGLYRSLKARENEGSLETMDWVNAYAIAVNEENAAGGRVVTSPTNGAAGIIPAVLHYYKYFVSDSDTEGVKRFLLAAGAIGILYKINASISGAEMGCQGEVGVACSMAAAGLVAAYRGSAWQLENAAEIGMEHNLGLTCDPIGGLVQIPCIERNAMGSVKAINAARLALQGDGSHKVSLDQVISTMRQTGIDMSTIYKETSQGGLAVNVPEC
ncbi:MAG: L-serine ammonia-lyase [Woeseia sp.]